MEQIKIGVVGMGFIGKQHIEAIRRIPGCVVTAVAGSDESRAKKVAEDFAVPRHYNDYRKLIADPEVEIIHNCTANNLHFPINRDAIAAGKHIYSEKPLTRTAAEAAELEALARKAGVANGVNLNYRHNVMVKEMRERMRDDFGRVLTVYGEYLQDWLMYDTDYAWRMDAEVNGESRAMADIGTHCFDTLQYVMGQRIVALYAKLITVYPERKKCEGTGESFAGSGGKPVEALPVSTEDAGFVMILFEDGTPGLVQVSQVQAGKKNGLAVTFSGASYSMHWEQEAADRLHLGRRDRGNEELIAGGVGLTGMAQNFATLPGGHAVAWADAFRNGIAVFYNSIRSGTYREEKQEYVTFASGTQLMRLVEACLHSNRTGEWVNVE